MRVGVLDQRRLAGGLVDGEDRDRVLAAREYLLALEVGQPEGAVGQIDKAPVGMDVDRARAAARNFDAGSSSVSLMNSGSRDRPVAGSRL